LLPSFHHFFRWCIFSVATISHLLFSSPIKAI
jgi:hypothetical protein